MCWPGADVAAGFKNLPDLVAKLQSTFSHGAALQQGQPPPPSGLDSGQPAASAGLEDRQPTIPDAARPKNGKALFPQSVLEGLPSDLSHREVHLHPSLLVRMRSHPHCSLCCWVGAAQGRRGSRWGVTCPGWAPQGSHHLASPRPAEARRPSAPPALAACMWAPTTPCSRAPAAPSRATLTDLWAWPTPSGPALACPASAHPAALGSRGACPAAHAGTPSVRQAWRSVPFSHPQAPQHHAARAGCCDGRRVPCALIETGGSFGVQGFRPGDFQRGGNGRGMGGWQGVHPDIMPPGPGGGELFDDGFL